MRDESRERKQENRGKREEDMSSSKGGEMMYEGYAGRTIQSLLETCKLLVKY
jgi:hypothetical protein